MLALLVLAIGIHTDFEAGSVGKVERRSPTHLRCGVIGETDQEGRNRQPSWFYFRLDGVGGREVTIDLADLHGEYNYKPYTGAIFRTMQPVYSEDDRHWTHVPAAWIAEEDVLRIRVRAKGDRVWIARQPPYTTARLRDLLEEYRKSPYLKQEVAGRTVGGRPMWLLTVTDQPAADKPVLWLMARQHAWESGTSWAAEGALRFLLSEDPRAVRIRRLCVFKIFPMADPDGVARGGVRFNRNGYDLNRNWDTADPKLTPEIAAQQRAILAGRADLFITLHNTETQDYLEGPAKFHPLGETLSRLLDQTTTFYAPKGPRAAPPSAAKGRFTANQWLFAERGIPAFLIELMVDPNAKIRRAPTVADRLEFGARLAEAMAGHAALQALPEYLRPDPFGGILASDRTSSAEDLRLAAPRGGYVSFQLVVRMPDGGPYSLALKLPLPVDLFREWFHFTPSDGQYRPDALVPMSAPYRSQLPEPDNHVEKQTAQAFWVDVWIPPETRPGPYTGAAELEAGGRRTSIPIRIDVLGARFPPEDAVTIDHNSYGSGWIADAYPAAREREGAGFFTSGRFFSLIHAYHRIFYEHRGTFHQLGYGHGGKTGPEFAPALEGSGKTRRIKDWALFDRHYGPLLDGTAFAGTRRGPRPIPFVYLPINPDWPASFLWWGEPGYEAEFVNVVSAMERHFREKGWTRTSFELFFNHKKRYKAYPWDGDEARFDKDLPFFAEYGRLLKKAVPAGSPVKFVFRADVSWLMERQFKEQAGIVNFWVAGGTEFSWFPYAPKLLRDRGDVVWFYSGPPNVAKVSSAITLFPVKAWMWGIDGYIHWQTVSAGRDPWFHFDGGETALVYPGERFGIEGPIPSIRLKLQRNCAQDLALLSRLSASRGEVARRYNGTAPEDWWNPRPPVADTPPQEWTNADIDQAPRPNDRSFTNLDAAAWQNVRRFLLELAGEAK